MYIKHQLGWREREAQVISLGIIKMCSHLFSLIIKALKKYTPVLPSVELDFKPLHPFVISLPILPCTFSTTNWADIAAVRAGHGRKLLTR